MYGGRRTADLLQRNSRNEEAQAGYDASGTCESVESSTSPAPQDIFDAEEEVILAVSIACVVLALVGLLDRRAWPFVGLIAYVWLLTSISDYMPHRLTGIAMRAPIDLVGGFLGLGAISLYRRREWWALAGTSVFALMLLNHGVFWLSRFNGYDGWQAYANAINALLILQLAILAGPGGKVGVGYACSWARSILVGWRRGVRLGIGEVGSAHRTEGVPAQCSHRSPDGGSNRSVHVSETGI